MLLKFGRHNETFLMRLPGHSNIHGKEADGLIRQGFGYKLVEQKPAFGIRPSTVKFLQKGEIARNHDRQKAL